MEKLLIVWPSTFENIVANGKIAHNVQFYLFPKRFLLYYKIILSVIDSLPILLDIFKGACSRFDTDEERYNIMYINLQMAHERL